jgi:hypothetical protein
MHVYTPPNMGISPNNIRIYVYICIYINVKMMIMALIHYTPTFDTEHAEQRPQSLVAGATRLRPITRSENLSGI